jgi:hypothetical protein
MISAYEQKNKNPLRDNDGDRAFNCAIMCPQSVLDALDPLIARSHDRQDRSGPSRPHEMFNGLGRTDKYRKGRKTEKCSAKFHMIGKQSSNENKMSDRWRQRASLQDVKF